MRGAQTHSQGMLPRQIASKDTVPPSVRVNSRPTISTQLAPPPHATTRTQRPSATMTAKRSSPSAPGCRGRSVQALACITSHRRQACLETRASGAHLHTARSRGSSPTSITRGLWILMTSRGLRYACQKSPLHLLLTRHSSARRVPRVPPQPHTDLLLTRHPSARRAQQVPAAHEPPHRLHVASLQAPDVATAHTFRAEGLG